MSGEAIRWFRPAFLLLPIFFFPPNLEGREARQSEAGGRNSVAWNHTR